MQPEFAIRALPDSHVQFGIVSRGLAQSLDIIRVNCGEPAVTQAFGTIEPGKDGPRSIDEFHFSGGGRDPQKLWQKVVEIR